MNCADASYTCDPNGNLETKTEGSDVWAYEWNAENQLKRVTKNGVEQARFAHDPMGRKVEKVAGGTTAFAYDGEDILRETAGATATRYVHGPGIDEPLARELSGVLTALQADGLGSVVKTTDAAGAASGATRYTAFGVLEMSALGTYGFTGREPDPETGLAYYRARYYDPKIGRFISEDPIGFFGGLNFYAYVGNNPVNWVDPLGLLVELYCVPVGQGSENPFHRAAGGAGLKHCFIRIKCDCPEYDHRLEVVGPDENGNADIPDPQRFASGGGKRAGIEPPDDDSSDCANEDCVLKMYRAAQRRGRPYSATGPNSNTFVKDLLLACGMKPTWPWIVVR